MDVNRSDRIGAIPRSSRLSTLLLITGLVSFAGVAAIALGGESLAFLEGELREIGLLPRESFSADYKNLGVPPLEAAIEAPTEVLLARLVREPCDSQTMNRLATAVTKAGEERWAADALVGWAGHSGPDNAMQLRQAASHYLDAHDYNHAFPIAGDLIAAHPHIADYRYFLGKAEVGLKRGDEALVNFANTIHLKAKPQNVGSWVFFEMSDPHAASGRICEAIGPIQDYVSRDPARRNTGNAARLMEDYAIKGHRGVFATGTETFSVADANVITPAFAKKAYLAATDGPRVRSDTANGAVYQNSISAGSIKVGRVEAKQVPVAILHGSIGSVDGLLGRSFPSRFDVTIASNSWSLRAKTAGAL